ncbi:hypothetical protein D3C73_1578010 [compost metagenome]
MDYELRINPIHDFLDQSIKEYEQIAAGMKTADGAQDQQLDELFLSALRAGWVQEISW